MMRGNTNEGRGDTKVKICGVTNPEDAALAASGGAWAIGLVFHPDSPRLVSPETAAEIGTAFKRRLEVVGVFVNASLDEVVGLAESCSLSMLQLHGEEGPLYCQEAARRAGVPVIKAARVRDAAQIRALSAYKTAYHLLDAYVPGRPGGTGQRFDWSLAAEHPPEPPFLLSGGITPQNVREAIETVSPFGIDVSSGVEASPGRKDPAKLRGLFDAVRDAAAAHV
jgi:phosphoribosylanthranilate isomerase